VETYLKLKRWRTVRRILLGSTLLISVAILIFFCVLMEKSKVPVEMPKIEYSSDVLPSYMVESLIGDTSRKTVYRYEEDYSAEITVSGFFALFSFVFLLSDLFGARIYYKVIDKEDVIIYSGAIGRVKLLVNGEEVDYMVPSRRSLFYKGFMETTLKSGLRITVSAQFHNSYHISFSDRRPSIDI